MQRWKLVIEYDGTDFCGWQMQENAWSVQECLEGAVRKLCGHPVRVHAAGRTDAGVHAVGQVVHVDLENDYPEKNVRDGLNHYMRPHAAAVVHAERVAADFHARFSAVNRVYCYKIMMSRRAHATIGNRYVWQMGWELDLDAMRVAARHLLGTHDFSSFRDAQCQAKSPVRTLSRLEIIETAYDLRHGRHVEIWVEAPSFLHHQVRNITGTLKMVGTGRWVPEKVKDVLEARNRSLAGPTAPPEGLFFIRVDY